MINLLRKNQQALMIVITILVIVSFVVLYNVSSFTRARPDILGSAYGHNVSKIEAHRLARKFDVALQLGLIDLAQSLAGAARSEGEARSQFVFNNIVLNREAERMEI